MALTTVSIAPWLLAPTLLLLVARAQAQLPPGTSDSTARPQLQERQKDDPLRTEAADAMSRRDYPTALKLLTRLDETYPNDPLVLFDLASAQDALDQTSAAEASYRRSISLHPDFFEPHLALGLLLARNHRDADARTELLSATNLKTPDPELKARAYRALAHLDAPTDPAEARDALIAAIKLSPETPDDTLLSAQLAEAAKDPASAEAAYRRVLARSPNDPAATSELAHLLLAQNKNAEAEPLLTAALAAHPDDPSLSAQLATLYLHENKPEQATTLVEKLHAGNPSNPAITRLYARLLSQSGKYEQSEPLFASLSRQSPADLTLADDRADALIHLKRYTEAQQILEPVLAHPSPSASHDDIASAASHLAFAATQNNDPETVLRALDLRATFLPQSPSSLFLAAAAHDKLHHRKQAEDLYKQFLSVADGKFPDEEWEARHRLIALDHLK